MNRQAGGRRDQMRPEAIEGEGEAAVRDHGDSAGYGGYDGFGGFTDGPPTYPAGREPAGPPLPTRRSPLAIAALALGLLSIPLAFGVYPGLLAGLLAVILGVAGLIVTRGGRAGGRGMATTGLITGLVGLVFAVSLGLYGLHTYRDCQDRLGHRPTTDELRACARGTT